MIIMKYLLNFWAVMTLAISSLALFGFINIIIFGIVSYHEHNLFILIVEFFIALFVFIISFYVAYMILFKGKNIKLQYIQRANQKEKIKK